MNIVVPQQVKDRFSEVQGQVQGKVVALGQLATNNYAELHKRFDQLPESVQQLWTGVRARLQLLLDIAPRAELLQLQTSVDELGLELGRVAADRDALKTELEALIEGKLAALSLSAAAAPVEIEAEAEVVEAAAEPKAERPAANGKAKNGSQRRR